MWRRIRVRPPSRWRKPAPKEFWDSLRDNQICVDIYGNQIFWGTLRELHKRGYYNNIESKKAAMQGTYRTYGWQYSAEQQAMGRQADPKKYKDCVPENPEKAPFPLHITEKINQRQAEKACRTFWRR